MSDREKMHEIEDGQVDAALKNFRESVHAWSEQELGRARTVRRAPRAGFWRMMASPAMGWAMAAVLVAGGVGIPVKVSHQRQVAAQEAAVAEQHRLVAEKEAKQAEVAMDDEELLNHVDDDIAQATPDAMEPLASMMRSTAKTGE
jgi:hypothetical protein